MNDTTIWLLIGTIAAGTYLIRLSFIQAWRWISVPDEFARALRYVPPAVFAALVLPAITVADGSIHLSPENFRLVAGLFAAIVAWYTQRVLVTLTVGMGTLWTLQTLF
jgi:branched-subunit amino acid transport protein